MIKTRTKHKDTDDMPEKPNIRYIFEILMTYNQFYRAKCITVSGFFKCA